MRRSRSNASICAGAAAAAAALLGLVSFAPTADAAHNSDLTRGARNVGGVSHQLSPAKRHGACYSNLSNGTGVAIFSQDFTDPGFDAYDSAGAVYFKVAKPCYVSEVYAVGNYGNGVGSADYETVTFYTDDGGAPGSVIDSQAVVGSDRLGTFTIPLNPVRIPAGPAWVSVTTTLAFSIGGAWSWELSSNDKGHGNSVWENPGDGFTTGCTSWQDVLTCTSFGDSFMVRLVKQHQH